MLHKLEHYDTVSSLDININLHIAREAAYVKMVEHCCNTQTPFKLYNDNGGEAYIFPATRRVISVIQGTIKTDITSNNYKQFRNSVKLAVAAHNKIFAGNKKINNFTTSPLVSV